MLASLAGGPAAAQVVVVVSAESPVENLSGAEIRDIYLGRTNQLPNGEPVMPINQRESSPAHEEFYSKYLNQSAAQIKAHWSKLIFTGRGQPPRTITGDEAAADFVAQNPNAIGYINADLVDDRLRVVAVE